MALAPPSTAEPVWFCTGVEDGYPLPPLRELSKKGAGILLQVPGNVDPQTC